MNLWTGHVWGSAWSNSESSGLLVLWHGRSKHLFNNHSIGNLEIGDLPT
jgi:hypothetical protein